MRGTLCASIRTDHCIRSVLHDQHAFRNEALLSAREKDVLQFLADGKSYKEISAALFLSIHTTRSHVQSIYRKLQVHSRAEIMRMLKLS